MCHFKGMKSFSFLSWKDERSLTLTWCKDKQKHTDKHVDMKLMGSLLSNCETTALYFTVLIPFWRWYLSWPWTPFERDLRTHAMFLGVCVVSSLFLSLCHRFVTFCHWKRSINTPVLTWKHTFMYFQHSSAKNCLEICRIKAEKLWIPRREGSFSVAASSVAWVLSAGLVGRADDE